MSENKKHFYPFENMAYFLLVAVWYWGQYQQWKGDWLDSDCYFHALRLSDALTHGFWKEQLFLYTNYPFGEVLHWTRALDILWGILALPFLLFYDVRNAVFYSGMLLAPVFFIGAVFYLLKAARLLFDYKLRILLAILIMVQANVIRVAFINRPDHHVVLFFLTAFILYKMLKFTMKGKKSDLRVAAVATAFSLWAATEGFFLFAATTGFLFYGVLFLNYPYITTLRFSFVYAVALSVFYVINPPYEGYLFMDSGRISLFYVAAIWGFNAFVWLSTKLKKLSYQIGFVIGGCLLIGGIYYGCGWLVSPLDERLYIPFVARISEMAAGNLYTLAYPMVAVICAVGLFRRFHRDASFIFLVINLGLFSVLTALSMRFLPYSGVYAVFILTLFVSVVKAKKICAFFFVVLEYFSFTLHFLFGDMKPTPVFNTDITPLLALKPGVVATELFYAPYFLWYTPHKVLASPYHRNVEGILDNHRIFFSDNQAEVISLLKKHQVSYIYLPIGVDDDYYKEPEKNCDKLYGAIMGCHRYPSYLRVLHEKKDYYLFEVLKDKI